MSRLDGPCVFKIRGSPLHSLICLVVSIVYGLFLASSLDSHFKDYGNYINYADNSLLIFLNYASRGYADIIFNEPLWLATNLSLKTFLGGESSLRLIIFCSMSTSAFLLLKNNPKHFVWICLFLIHPQVVKNGLVHIRQGLAIAVFLLGWYSISPKRRFLFLLFSPFIHSSFFIIIAVYFFSKLMRYFHFSFNLTNSFVGLFGLSMGFALPFISMMLGARQGAYEIGLNISGLGFVLWGVTLAILISGGRQFSEKNLFEISLLTFYLSLYWVSPFSARVLEGGLVLVLASGLYLAGIKRYTFLSLMVFDIAVSWFMRIGQPSLGFGA